MSMPLWIVAVGWVTKAILALLAVLSVWSFSIILDRRKFLGTFATLSADPAEDWIRKKDWPALKTWASKQPGLRPGVILAALDTGTTDAEKVERAVKSYLSSEKPKFEKGLTVLATLGSNAPFIGLFGTVLGIIQAFGALAHSQSNTNLVMAGISEALVATAVGLFVAIPAVIAFNLFSRKIKLLITDAETLRDLYLSRQN